MCGIVGYIGQNEAAPVLIKGLKKLEYRGYDSAGIAVFGDGIHVVKTKGRLADLDAKVQEMGCKRSGWYRSYKMGNPWRTQRCEFPSSYKHERQNFRCA